jgi:hypothetical protein
MQQPYNQPPSQYTQYPPPGNVQDNVAMQEFMFSDGMGMRRVQLSQNEKGKSILVLLDGATIGSINTPQEFIYGREFILPDGSMLKVQLVNDHVQVSRNGLFLPVLPPPGVQPYPPTRYAAILSASTLTVLSRASRISSI